MGQTSSSGAASGAPELREHDESLHLYGPDQALLKSHTPADTPQVTFTRLCDYCRKEIRAQSTWAYCPTCDTGQSFDICAACFKASQHCHSVRFLCDRSLLFVPELPPETSTLSLQLLHNLTAWSHRSAVATVRVGADALSMQDVQRHLKQIEDQVETRLKNIQRLLDSDIARRAPGSPQDGVDNKLKSPASSSRDSLKSSELPMRFWNETQGTRFRFTSYNEIYWRARWFCSALIAHFFGRGRCTASQPIATRIERSAGLLGGAEGPEIRCSAVLMGSVGCQRIHWNDCLLIACVTVTAIVLV